MNVFSAAIRSAAWRAWVVCCLLVAVPVHGVSSSLVMAMGSLHFHTAVTRADVAAASSGSMAGWQDFRRMSGSAGTDAPTHVHDALGRHVHAPGDPSVTVVGDSGNASRGMATSSAGVSFDAVPSAMPSVPPRSSQAVPVRWRIAAATAFASLTILPLERPPNASRA